MPIAKLYHNPRCSKSRQALTFLQSSEVDFEVVEYLKTAPTIDEYKAIFSGLAIENIYDMVRSKEPEFKLAGLSKDACEQTILSALVEYPKLLERPILVMSDGRAAIGRPLENIKALINA